MNPLKGLGQFGRARAWMVKKEAIPALRKAATRKIKTPLAPLSKLQQMSIAGTVDKAAGGLIDRGSTLKTMGSWMMGNLRADAGGGLGSIAYKAGMSALKGGVIGGLAGGVSSAVQGGSFWEGAKDGAWDGAIGWGMYSTAARSLGASRATPFGRKRDSQGIFKAAQNMFDYSSGDVSKQAKVLLSQKQRAGMTNRIMNAHR